MTSRRRFAGTDVGPAFWLLDPVAGEVVAHREAKKNRQPSESGGGDDLGELAAVTQVHEKQGYEKSFRKGDDQRDDSVQSSEVQIGDRDRRGGEGPQGQKDGHVGFEGDDMLGL